MGLYGYHALLELLYKAGDGCTNLLSSVSPGADTDGLCVQSVDRLCVFPAASRKKNADMVSVQVTFHNKDGSFFPSQLVALDSGPAVLAAWLKHSLQRSRCLACGLPQAMKTSPRQVGKERGQGSYQVNPQVTSYHNLRSAPSLFSPIVGNLEAYDVVEVAQTIRLFGGEASGPEVWAQLCRTSAGPAIWTLQSDVEHVYLRKLLHSGDEEKTPEELDSSC